MSYEVWSKPKLATRKNLPDESYMTLDSAMEAAKKLSKGTIKQPVYNPKKQIPGVPHPGGWDQVDVPKAFAVVDRADARVRGWGIGGKWHDARSCKRCNDTGQDQTAFGYVCASCQGASYKPKV